MRVLHVNTSMDPVQGGGTAERVFRLCKALEPLGVESKVLTTGLVPVERIADLHPTQVVVLPHLIGRFQIPALNLRVIRETVEWADVVHVVGHWAPINALAFSAIRRRRRPYVVCPAGAIPPFGRSMKLKAWFDVLWGKRIISGATRGVAVVQGELEAFTAYGLSAKRVAVIPNGVALPSSDFVRPHSAGQRPYVLFLGRLSYIKGPDLLLKAFIQIADQIPQFDLVFAGPDDGMLAELTRISTESHHGQRIHFVGYVGGTAKQNMLAAAALLVVPSRREAMSIVALEAGAVGTPVLLTNQCGFDQLALHGGSIVEAGSAALAEGLRNLLLDSGLCGRGEALFSYISAEYSWDRAATRYAVLFEEALGGSNLLDE